MNGLISFVIHITLDGENSTMVEQHLLGQKPIMVKAVNLRKKDWLM